MKTHIVLWTSGWDSTFRLLQIILIEKQIVQPIYIIDESRKSLQHELKAIENIKQKLFEQFPESKSLLNPILLIEKEIIGENLEIKNAFEKLANTNKIGSQYEWLAKFCYAENLYNVEISIDKNLNPTSFGNFLKQNYLELSEKEVEKNKYYQTIDTVFKYFNFPVIYILKKEMLAISKKNNWLEIMQLTWFCHKPKNNKPCGKCNPCKTVIMKGLGFRIPLKNRLKGYFKIIKKNGLNW